jgi:sirohydrochlorin cobaltochelatase
VEVPIVITAFGTTTAARHSYSFVEERVKKALPGHEVHWAYSSRMVRDFFRDRTSLDLKGPSEILQELKERGHHWAVVQSLYLICGHEFYRLVEEIHQVPIRTSIGLPLLCSPEDYAQFIDSLPHSLSSPLQNDEAVVLVGHGTDHPSWICYMGLQGMVQNRLGPQWFLGVIEGHPSREDVLREIIEHQCQKVRIVPLVLVAGLHVQEDLSNSQDSWRASFEKEGLSVIVEKEGLLSRPGIIDILIRHVKEALDVIPSSR